MLSIRLAVFTVSPWMSYCNFFTPTVPDRTRVNAHPHLESG